MLYVSVRNTIFHYCNFDTNFVILRNTKPFLICVFNAIVMFPVV